MTFGRNENIKKTYEHVYQNCFFSKRTKAKVLAVVRLVDIERKMFQFVFFNENRTERMFGCFGATRDVKKLIFLGEKLGSCIIKWRKFCPKFSNRFENE